MENIAEINDLACNAIETGDYNTALDVLNCCLGCVKQLKNCRGPTTISDDGSITFDRNEEILNLLNEAKQKLTNNNNNNTSYKRKSMTSSVIPTSITVSTKSTTSTSRGTAVSQPRKRQRFEQQQEETECPCSFTASASATTHSNEEHAYTHNQQSDDDEDCYFVYRKPLRFTKFQWSRIAECSRSTTTRSGSSGRAQQQERRWQQIEREVELAVSSNLIFNIALSHHLVASAPAKKSPTEKRRVSFAPSEDNHSCSSFSDTDDDDDDDDLSADENGCGYGSDGDSWCDENRYRNDQHALQTEQRLRGALRLYELGFRVHSKRVASAKSISMAPPAAANNGNTVPSSFSSSTTRRRHDQGRSVPPTQAAGTDSSNNNNGSERDDELRSTTRFALALLNNCAHIHDALGQTDKAEIFRQRLMNFLVAIVDGSESIHEVIGDDVAVDGYFKNVFTGTVFDTDNAPAAMA